MSNSMVMDLTKGSIAKLLLKFAFPLFLSNTFTMAGCTIVGQNLGAKKYKRVPEILKTVTICSMIVCGLFTLVILIYPNRVFSAFIYDKKSLKSHQSLLCL